MSDRGDFLELVCDAYGRLPTLSATVHSWMHMERNEGAMDEARHRFNGGPVSGIYSGNRSGRAEYEGQELLVLDPRRGAFRVEHEDSWDRRQVFVSDGQTTWTRNFRGDIIADSEGPRHLPTRGFELLDPSWLVDYDCMGFIEERHNVRDVLRTRATISSAKPVIQSRMSLYATDVEVLIDARVGFLHRLTQFIDGQPFQEIELRDFVLDPVLDADVFQF